MTFGSVAGRWRIVKKFQENFADWMIEFATDIFDIADRKVEIHWIHVFDIGTASKGHYPGWKCPGRTAAFAHDLDIRMASVALNDGKQFLYVRFAPFQ